MKGERFSVTDLLGLVLLVALAIGIGVFLFRDDTIPVERSAIGSRGLVTWLREHEIEARYAGYQPVTRAQVGLRILPLLDTDTERPFLRPEADADYLRTGTERDIQSWVLARKVELLPTLLIAPKWTRAMRHSGLADPSLLLSAPEAAAPLGMFGPFYGDLVRPDARVFSFTHGAEGRQGLLYAPQLFPPALAPQCRGVISPPGGHLLIRCERGAEPPVHALSDPDLMNNHGLSLAGNAEIAAAVIGDMAGGGPVLVDTTDYIFTVPTLPPVAARDWRDLLRAFGYPFSLAWMGLAALTVLLLWRSSVRFGPPRLIHADRMGASRAVSITAKARLLRMTGNDRQLFEAHLRNRLRRIERRLFGQSGSADPVTRIVEHLKRRDPALAAGFAAAAAAATTAGNDTGGGRLLTLLEEFELQARRVVDGAG